MYRVRRQTNLGFSWRSFSRVDSMGKSYAAISEGQGLEQLVNLDNMFRTKPISLALPRGSPQRINEPNYKGIRLFILKLMLFYSKQSTSIRAANVIYHRVVSQVENPLVYDVFRLEKTFRTTYSMLVVHMWLCLRRLKVEGKEGVELGQYVYEVFNHDLEIRVSKAGVNLLLSKWMRELEKVFYGNVVAYDTAMLPEAKPDELQNTIWKNVFSDDGSPTFDAAALPAVLALSRYVRRECSCLSMTDKESMFSGNFMFTTIYNPNTPESRLKNISDDIAMHCTSWRIAVEANNLGPWKTIPDECADYVKDYMLGRSYNIDLEKVSKESGIYANSLELRGDGMDAWVFDIDETLISNLPYYSDHGYGLEVFNNAQFDKWILEGVAPAIKPSLKLYEEVVRLGFKIILLTGRYENKRNITVTNLTHAGYQKWDKLILRGEQDREKSAVAFKSEKRKEITDEGFRILGNSGDQWSDLVGSSTASRSFKLSNPMYHIP